MNPRIAVMGAGLIGKRHAMDVAASGDAEPACVIDPSPVGQAVAAEYGAPWMQSRDKPRQAPGRMESSWRRPTGCTSRTPSTASRPAYPR